MNDEQEKNVCPPGTDWSERDPTEYNKVEPAAQDKTGTVCTIYYSR